MSVITVYSRRGCHLCDEAEQVVRRVVRGTDGRPDAHAVEIVDIDLDPALVDRYTVRVPVVAVDGVEIAQYQLDPAVLEAALTR